MTRTKRTCVAIVGIGVCALLAALLAHHSMTGIASVTPQEGDILEAVFRYQFTHSGEGVEKVPGFFLVIAGNDPPDAFLERFAGHSPPVQKGSQYGHDAGVQFSARVLKWK